MKEKQIDVVELTPQMMEMIAGLLDKSKTVFKKTEEHANCTLYVEGVNVPIRVDDIQLLFIGCVLLPNIINYLVNILPQFVYPYVVAYLQDLSEMREDPVTINELFNYLTDYNDGNIFECAQTENQTK